MSIARGSSAALNRVNSSIIRARRRRTGTAAAAYSHALALTGDAYQAELLAASALRRGAHSRSAVLAHARHMSAPHAFTTSAGALASRDLRSLAMQLSSSRPAEERSIVDLELRYGLDHGTFSRALGVSAVRARQRSAEIATTWADSLDPAMMASLGPGSCDGLAALLTESGVRATETPSESLAATGTDTAITAASPADVVSPTVGSLLSAAPAVLAHAKTCDICAQRLKLMTSVRSLAGQLPVAEVPKSVQEAARSTRRLLPTPLPPSIDANRIDPRRFRTIAATVVGALLLVVSGFGVIGFFNDRAQGDSQSERVEKLIAEAPTSSLLATPSEIKTSTSTAALANNSSQAVLWKAETSAPWLSVAPVSGRLAPNQNVSIAVKASRSGKATITITGSDGAKQTIQFEN